jgi:hypothetical protein
MGTALRSDTYDLGPEPVLTNLSALDLAKLVEHGYWPVGLIAETTATYVKTGYKTSQIYARPKLRWTNQELTDLSRGPYEAR